MEDDLEKGEDGGRRCRICHLNLGDSPHHEEESGRAMELGCKCKNDLAFVHERCADEWFKIKGNNICEICGSTATNMVLISDERVVVANASFANDDTSGPDPDPIPAEAAPPADSRPFWSGHRVLNILLASVVFAFIVSWVFHFRLANT